MSGLPDSGHDWAIYENRAGKAVSGFLLPWRFPGGEADNGEKLRAMRRSGAATYCRLLYPR
jgi:hypothetical protein